MIKIKRVYENFGKNDGFRILVDRLWPRGISKEKAGIKAWMKEIAPSYGIIKGFHSGGDWAGFKEKYRKELKEKKGLLEEIKNHEKKYKIVTLVYSAKDEKHNQAVILKEVLKSGKV